MLMPQGVIGAPLNSPAYSAKEDARGKKVKLIRTPGKPRRGKAVTPYGDFCSRCSKYGTGRKPINMNEAVAAMKHYFKSKGLNVKKVGGRGRFLKAEIYKGDLLVDRVLFDRRTGRIRSIY